ncbi:RHS repeat-associated core domain-containing protein, partial [Arthrobacter sp. 1088]|uniref:RHS repeat-associated core domain-containing protein n=1 Tax=Arthrobacter sp. 1088 TaxID=2817768 RepID=UPI00286BA243
ITRPGLESTYKYDGLGRNLTTTDTTHYGTHETATAFNGLTPLQNTDNHGAGSQNTTNLIPDNLGHVTLQTGTTTIEDRWALLDKLGSTIAQTTGTNDGNGVISELSEYTDYGIQEYGTTGWDADPNYTGQTTNSTYGTHRFHARTLDPSTGTWTGQDTWRGLLTQPKSLHRYNYVNNNPATFIDHLGYDPVLSDGTDWNAISPSSYGYADDWVTPIPSNPGPWRTGYVYPTPVAPTPPPPAPAQNQTGEMIGGAAGALLLGGLCTALTLGACAPFAIAGGIIGAGIGYGLSNQGHTTANGYINSMAGGALWGLPLPVKGPGALSAFPLRHPQYTAKFGGESYLADHFARHGSALGATSAAGYEKMAAEFLQGPISPSTIEKVRTNGDIVRFNSSTQEFGILSKDGVVRTYYVPDPTKTGMSNLEYFLKEGSK